jgi:hypothetical protein
MLVPDEPASPLLGAGFAGRGYRPYWWVQDHDLELAAPWAVAEYYRVRSAAAGRVPTSAPAVG